MKRSGYLKRYTRLTAKKPLRATKTLGRSVPARGEAHRPGRPSAPPEAPSARDKPKKVKRSNALRKGIIPSGLRKQVNARANGRCEACGEWMSASHLHHRKLRAQSGQNTAENLIAIHHACHLVIHEVLPRELAEEYGYIVPSHKEPADVEVIVSRDPFWENVKLVKAGMA